MATSNPVFSTDMTAGYDQVYGVPRAPSTVMTLQGTVGKTFLLLAIMSTTAIFAWNSAASGQFQPAAYIGALVGSAILALITIFRPTAAPWTAPLYAAFEGVLLGAYSFLVERGLAMRFAKAGVVYEGIAIQAVMLTAGTLFVMLFLYRSGLVRVTNKLRMGITAATGAVCLLYITSIGLSFFGASVPFLHTPTPIGIGIGLVIVGIAAFNLLLDFDSIEQRASMGLPKFQEWYSAFGLILSLVWIYLEVLRLLRMFYDRRD